jgi:hypothetical protein
MRKAELDIIINQIDEFRSYFVKVRSRFPYISERNIGRNYLLPPTYYRNEGINFKIQLDKPIDESIREELNTIGHFVNQNFILRLFSILNYYGFVSDNVTLSKQSPGFQEMDIVRRLRNKYAHSLGKFNPENSEDQKLKDIMEEYFELDIGDYDEIPLNISAVIDKLIDGCKKYIRNNY